MTEDRPALERLKEHERKVHERGRPLSERIEDAYDRAIEQWRLLEYAQWRLDSEQEKVKARLGGVYGGDILANALAKDDEYQKARDDRDSAKLEYELARIESCRLDALLELKKAEGGY